MWPDRYPMGKLAWVGDGRCIPSRLTRSAAPKDKPAFFSAVLAVLLDSLRS